MTSDELYDLFRKDVVDTAKPYLWSDEEVFAYMNDAYFMFVRLTGGVSDFTSSATTVAALQGDPLAEIDQNILLVRMATLEPTGDTIKVINAQDVENLSDEDFGLLRRLNTSTTVGRVKYMVVGMEPGLVRWINTPDQDYTVKLLIERLPLTTITGAGQTLDDVAAHHHLHLLKGMRALAYRKQDAETFDRAKADTEQAAFEAYCAFAKREKDRYKHKVRVVRYGGI